jgi:pyrroloquinoline quinone biosynthesis protein E
MTDATLSNPLALIAELTHRCPLHCVYCSNPQELSARQDELPTESWIHVLQQAAALGVMQVDLTGGEPLARPDLPALIRTARAANLYVNLITSGLPLDEKRLDELIAAGLDHFQLSFQGAQQDTASEISGGKSHAQKLRVLEWLRSRRVGVTLNFVIHRRNLGQLEEMLAIAESSSASRVEFAHVQYYGWALANREQLLPTREQLTRSLDFFKNAQERLRGKIRIDYVVPDYYAKFPKPCMGGWARKVILITPSGEALPCHAATVIPGLQFENVKEKSLAEIWQKSEAFQKFRGEDWMQEPCKSCDRRSVDFGGCRCQALLLAGNAAATDPVCSLSPQRTRVDAIISAIRETSPANSSSDSVVQPAWLYRPNPA